VHLYRILEGLITRMDVEKPGGGTIRYVGGPTAIIEIGGLRLLLDPTFDPPGEYPIGERVHTKPQPPAFEASQLGDIDAVLLSHDQHPDNLDRLGRQILAAAPLVLSTASAARRLGPPVQALANWQSFELPRPGAPPIQVTGVPAQHGPDGSEELVGEVTGFVLSAAGCPTVYISGDNASLDVVRTINEQLGPFDAAILNVGAARTALADGAPLTLTSELAADVAATLGGPPVVPLHFEGWAHFTEGAESLRATFERRGLSQCLHLPVPGEMIRL
jgi:L-ascorbate metabolism protein UlaG (beta-lactamase superfamily)